MNMDESDVPRAPTGRPADAPLESWKEIGAYLQRNAVTVRRWEREEGLPVRRHIHNSRSSVYAYPSEIDAWRASRKAVVEPPVLPLWRTLLAPSRSMAFAVTMLTCLIMVGNGIRPSAASAQQRETGIEVKKVWENATLNAGGPSPDGRHLAWVNWSGSGGNLAIHDLDTGENRDLTTGSPGSFAERPVFSPDGRQVLFGWYNSPKDTWELRLIHTDGSGERVFPFGGYGGAISPDGKRAAVAIDQNGVQQLALLDLASGKITLLKEVGWRKPQIGNFSADGRYLVYSALVAPDSLDREVYAISVDGSSEDKLVRAPGVNQGAFFAPDGSNVVFTSNRSGRWDLWAIRISRGKTDGAPQLLKTDIGSVTNLGFTRDGTLFFSQRIDQRDALTAEVERSSWIIMRSPQRVSNRLIGNSGAPRWSPDGQLLAYVAVQGQTDSHGSSEVSFVIRSNRSAREHELKAPFHGAGLAENFRWFPDGKSLLLVEWQSGSSNLRKFRRLDLATGEVSSLFNAPFGRPESIAVMPDGQRVLYTGNAERYGALIAHDLRNGHETIVAKLPGVHALAVSPDGAQAATIGPPSVKGSQWAVWITPLAGGKPREVWRPKDKWLQPGTMTWDPQGHALFLISSEGNDYWAKEQGIWCVPLDGGEPHNIGIKMPKLSSISIDPDGRHIGFTGGTSSEQVWSLRNLFSETRAVR